MPRGLQRHAELVVLEVETQVGRGGRRDPERAEAIALVRLRLGAVHLEPARGAAAEAQGAAVVARAEKDDLPDAATEATGDLGVDHLRALRQCGAAADRDVHRAGDGAVEAALGLDVTTGGRRARAFQAESLRRGEAGRQGGMAGAAQGDRRRGPDARDDAGAEGGTAVALRWGSPWPSPCAGWPRRNDR